MKLKFCSVARNVKALKTEFSDLVVKFRRSARKENIYVKDLTSIIQTQLVDHQRYTSPMVSQHCKRINSIQTTDEYFDYLTAHGFLGYLNYALLMQIAKLLEDKSVLKIVQQYQNSYKGLLSEPSIQEIVHVFIHDPTFRPTSIIGLPEIIFDLDNPWPEKSIPTWDEYYHTRFPWASSTSLQAVESKCVRLRYAVLPCVYDAVVKDVHDDCVIAELREININIAHFTEVTFTERVEIHETTLVSTIIMLRVSLSALVLVIQKSIF